MKTKHTIQKIIAAMFLLLFSGSIWATNIQFTDGPVIVERNIANNEIIVEFSFGWDNSWNLNSPPNHDAAWIFMKFRPLGQHGFRHANLHPVEDIVMGTDGHGAGSTRHNVKYGESPRLNDSPVTTGVFLYRSEISVGTNVFENVRLHWDITGTGIDENTVLSVRIYAIEMVYIPMGTFASVHTVLETGHINTVTGTAPGGVARVVHGVATADAIANNAHWPLGTQPFYIMKHEVSQHAWVDFLNSLTLEQQMNLSHVTPTAPNNTRFGAVHGTFEHRTWSASVPDFRNSRMNIRIRQQAVGNAPAIYGVNASQDDVSPNVTPPGGWNHETQGGNLPMFGLAWTDVMAYLDWAALRPLTELEYEKACRGPLQVVAGEMAWGTTVWIPNQSFDNRNHPTEVSGTPGANMAHINVGNTAQSVHDAASFARWPIRVGAFARENTTRIQAGASFWGVLNLSDNAAERYIQFDHATGQLFRARHGDGNLSGEGMADVPCWPGVLLVQNRAAGAAILGTMFAAGTGYRGPGMAVNTHTLHLQDVSNRTFIASTAGDNNWRDPWTGIRGGRSVPVDFAVLAHPSIVARATNIHNVATHAQGTVPVPWQPITHTLRISAVGGEPPYTYQWFWTEAEPMDGQLPGGGTEITGATSLTYFPPTTQPHGPRFFYAEITDQTGTTVTTRVSGMHTVLGIATHPSTASVTTSLTQGTNVLEIMEAGGAPPFTIQWFVTPNGTPGIQGSAGTFVGNPPAERNLHPIIPIWLAGNHYTYWAQITDARGVVMRTAQSGSHLASVITDGGNRNVWFGPGDQGTAFPDPHGVAQSRAGADVNASDWTFQANLPVGLYRLEAWGASGGRGGHQANSWNIGSLAQRTHGTSAFGGYTQTFYRVEDPTAIFIVPGGSGVHGHFILAEVPAAPALPGQWLPGGFNGGGRGGSTFFNNAFRDQRSTLQSTPSGSGGGATHISFVSGLLTDPAVRNNILIVAGGGGGTGHSGSAGWRGLPGHATEGTVHGRGQTASETEGGAAGLWHSAIVAGRLVNPQPGTAGRGGDGGVGFPLTGGPTWQHQHIPYFGGGGGGGWFGGGAVYTDGGAGGGSGYVLTSASHKPAGYFTQHASYYITNGLTVQPTEVGFVANPDPSGNGFVRITFISSSGECDYDTNSVAMDAILSPGKSEALGSTVPVTVRIRNMGLNDLDSCYINWSLNGVTQLSPPYVYRNPNGLQDGFTDIVNLGSYVQSSPSDRIVVWVSMPNGVVDLDISDDTLKTDVITCMPSLMSGTVTVGVGRDYPTINT
jgi:formylglycine-generating enzyme required for sulfatase activity